MITFVLWVVLWTAGTRVTSPDLFLHVHLGETILDCRCLPRADDWSYTHRGKRWHLNAWVGSLLIGAAHRFGAEEGLLAFKLAAVWAAFWLMAGVAAARLGTGWGALLLAGSGLYAARHFFDINPLMMGFLLFLLLLRLLLAASPRRLLQAPPLMLLWVNAHPSFPLGIVMLTLFVLGCPRSERALRRAGLLALIGSLLLLWLNPSGLPGILYPAGLQLQRTIFAQTQQNWQPTLPFGPGLFGYSILLFLGSFVLVFALFSPPKNAEAGVVARWRFALMMGWTLLFFSLTAVRHTAFYALFFPALFAWAWPGQSRQATCAPVAGRGPLLAASLLVFPFFTAASARSSHLSFSFLTGADRFPAEAAAYIEQRGLPPPLFHEYDWGNFLAYRLSPGYGVFIDGRADTLYPADFYGRTLEAWSNPAVFNDLARTFGFRTVVLYRDRPLARRLRASPAWKEVYHDHLSVIFVRRDAYRNRFDIESPDDRPDGFYRLFLLGKEAFEREDAAGAERFWRAASVVAPALLTPYQNIGFLRLRQGDRPGARRAFLRCLHHDPWHPPCLKGYRRAGGSPWQVWLFRLLKQVG